MRENIDADGVVFVGCLIGAAFFLGMEVGAEKSAVELQPCPKQANMRVKSSVVNDKVLTCYYEPEKIPRRL